MRQNEIGYNESGKIPVLPISFLKLCTLIERGGASDRNIKTRYSSKGHQHMYEHACQGLQDVQKKSSVHIPWEIPFLSCLDTGVG